MKNKIYFSESQSQYLSGADFVLSFLTEMSLGEPSSYRTTFFAAMLQSGISRLVLPSNLADECTEEPFLLSRVDRITKEQGNSDYKLISEVFQNHLPKDYIQDTKYCDVLSLQSFLADLCTSLRLNAGLFYPGRIPQAVSFSGLIPPELLTPITFLLNAVTPCPVSGLLPKFKVGKRNVGVFHDLLESLWFKEFCAAHESLNDATVTPDVIVPQIRAKASSLLSNYDSQLTRSNVAASLLSLSPEIIGKSIDQPGAISGLFRQFIEPYLKKKCRLVIYDSSPIYQYIAIATMCHLAENHDPDDVVLKRLKKYRTNQSQMKSC